MSAPKRVLCIMDMAVVGRSSMAVVLPVLAACGAQGCPLPTALFSSHTGGFSDVQVQDNSAFASRALQHFAQENVSFDAVYIGYLCSETQIQVAKQALAQFGAALKVVDPALGDGGKPYHGITPAIIAGMRELCSVADLITPNATEKALLEHLEPKGSILTTSVEGTDGEMQVCGYSAAGDSSFTVPTPHLPQNYPGTGDLFTAAVTGLLLAGKTLETAARTASGFVREAVRMAWEGGGEVRQGTWFERALPLLLLSIKKYKNIL